MRASVLVAAVLTLPFASGGVPPGVPPDGPAGAVTDLGALLRGGPGWGANVTTPVVEVVNVSCPDCPSATTAADFWVRDANHTTLRVHESHAWQSTYNVKKQLFVPTDGMRVVVQGRLENDSTGWFLEAKRWAEESHQGTTATITDIATGKIPTGTYVWVPGALVGNVARWNDGDYSFDLTDGSSGNLFVHAEIGPPFWGQLRIPHVNDTVNPYGMVRYDPDHKWWEIHPVRCWSPAECVPLAASYVRNGPPPGTPPTGGSYLEGHPLSEEGNASRSEYELGRLNFTILEANETTLVARVGSANVTRVDLSFDNATWMPMARDRGNWTWTTTKHGPTFRLRATYPDGAGATSGLFEWRVNASEPPDMGDVQDPIIDPTAPSPVDQPATPGAPSPPPAATPTQESGAHARIAGPTTAAVVALVFLVALARRRA